MKKLSITIVFALGVLAATQQHASAWCNSQFSIGLSWNLQSGGNNLLWGLWQSGDVPSPYGSAPAAYGYPAPAYGYPGAYVPDNAFGRANGQAPAYAAPATPAYTPGSNYYPASYPRWQPVFQED